MAKRVCFFVDYVIEDATDDEDALEQAEEKLNEDMDKGWFSLDYVITDEEQRNLLFFSWRAAHDPCAANLPLYHVPAFLSRKSCEKIAQNFIPKFVQFVACFLGGNRL